MEQRIGKGGNNLALRLYKYVRLLQLSFFLDEL